MGPDTGADKAANLRYRPQTRVRYQEPLDNAGGGEWQGVSMKGQIFATFT